MECRRALFKKHNGIHAFHIPVAEILLSPPYPLILAQQQVRRVAGAPLAGEKIPYSLHFHIGNAPVSKRHHDIHPQKDAFVGKPRRVRGNRCDHLKLLTQKAGEEIAEPLRDVFRVHDLLEKSVVQEL